MDRSKFVAARERRIKSCTSKLGSGAIPLEESVKVPETGLPRGILGEGLMSSLEVLNETRS